MRESPVRSPQAISRRRRARIALAAAWSLLVVAVIFWIVESVLAAWGVGLPHMHWFWDASVLHATPIFVPGGEAGTLATDPLFVRADNPPQAFARAKGGGVHRIFCVGASTTAGWPFHRRAGYPAWLRALARDAVPDRAIEVVNAGIHGFDTVRTIAVADEVLAYEPDWIVLYTGYNDRGGFPLRHRGGAMRRILRRVHSALLLSSRLYNVLLGASARTPETAVSRSWAELTIDEDATLLEEYGTSIRRFVARARSRGTSVALVTLPYSDRYVGGGPLPAMWRRMNATLRAIAAEGGVALVEAAPLSELPGALVDSVHASVEGYGWIAHRVLGTLCTSGAFGAGCRLDRLRSDDAYAEALGANEPGFVVETQLRLAEFYLEKGDDRALRGALRHAARHAPAAGPGSLVEWARGVGKPGLFAALEEAGGDTGWSVPLRQSSLRP